MTDLERQQVLDFEHLRLLRLGYLISGGANAVWALFPLIHVTVGLIMLAGGFGDPDGDMEGFGPRFPGLLFVVMGSFFSSMLGTLAVLKLLTAKWIQQRRKRTFCIVTAALTCLGIPYGTTLGVFTILVLGRSSVEFLFADGPSEADSRRV